MNDKKQSKAEQRRWHKLCLLLKEHWHRILPGVLVIIASLVICLLYLSPEQRATNNHIWLQLYLGALATIGVVALCKPQIITSNPKEYFITRVLVTGITGGVFALLLPIAVKSTTTGVGGLRHSILLATGGLLAILTLGETRRKNDIDKRKNKQEKKKNDKDYRRQVRAERRERYAKAVEQLGDEKAPIRMGGVYTLVGLVDEWLEEKSLSDDQKLKEGQVIINNLCAYVRSPFTLASHYDELSKPSPTSKGIYKGKKEKLYADKATLDSEADVRLSIIKEIHDRLQGPEENTSGTWSEFEYNFSGSRFFYSVDLTNSYYTKSVNFSGSVYEGEADFSGSVYKSEADFGGSTYQGEAGFSGSTYQGEAAFTDSTYEKNATFSTPNSRSTYKDTADFSGSTYWGHADFTDSTYEKNATFSTPNSRSTYKDTADFSGSTYWGHADFTDSTYEKNATFSTPNSRSTYKDTADFSGSTYKDTANFSRSTYEGGANFSRSTYQCQWAYFSDSTYEGGADFSESTYEGGAYFSDSTYEDGADFSDSTYKSWAYFSRSTYQDGAYFSRSTYQDGADFSRSTYQWANFSDSTYQGGAYFSDSTYQGGAYFGDSTYKDVADFSGSIFYQETYFGEDGYGNSSSCFTNCTPQFYDKKKRKNTIFGSHNNDFTVDIDKGYPIDLDSKGIPLNCKFLTSEQKEYLADKFREIEKTNNKLLEVKDDEEKARLSDMLRSLYKELHEWQEEATTVKVEDVAAEDTES